MIDFWLEKIKDAQFLRQMVINSEIDAAVTSRRASNTHYLFYTWSLKEEK